MLGSDGEGERSNAAALATRLLKENGLTWSETVSGAGTVQAPQQRWNGDAARVSILEGQLRMAHQTIASNSCEIRRLKDQIASLQMKLTTAEGEVLAAWRAFKQADPEVKMHSPDKDNDGTRKFASKMQAILNWSIDQIEDAIELSEWEQGFLKSMRELKWKISPKQFAKLVDMADRAGVDLSELAAEIG
jgi:diketogulonate reductase-like aldo/keto reductase